MKKIAIFWEKRFENNNFKNISLDENLNPYFELSKYNGHDKTISLNLLDRRVDKDDFIILCLLQLTPFTVLQYIIFFICYRNYKKYFFIYEPPVVMKLNYSSVFHIFFDRIYSWNDNFIDNKKYFKYCTRTMP